MNRRTVLLVVAAILALGAGLLTFDFLASQGHQTAQSPPRAVLVANEPIAAHASISASMVQVVMRPTDAVDPDALSSPEQIRGLTALGPIPAGGTLTISNTTRGENGEFALHVRPGMRAVSIPVDDVKDVSGLVQPGDRVDVVAVPPRAGNAQPRAYTILRDIECLAVGGVMQMAAPNPSPSPGQAPQPVEVRTVTLEVTPTQADTLAMSDINATLRLALRSPRDTNALMAEDINFPTTQVGSGPAPATGGPVRRADPPRRFISPVVVIDGDHIDSGTEK
jgi:pilus assembly protein CpaB